MTNWADKWYGHDGENASATCMSEDCEFYRGGLKIRRATRWAQEHASKTGHSVEVERALFRIVRPA